MTSRFCCCFCCQKCWCMSATWEWLVTLQPLPFWPWFCIELILDVPRQMFPPLFFFFFFGFFSSPIVSKCPWCAEMTFFFFFSPILWFLILLWVLRISDHIERHCPWCAKMPFFFFLFFMVFDFALASSLLRWYQTFTLPWCFRKEGLL